MNRLLLVLAAAVAMITTEDLHGRTFTSGDGKKLDAEIVSATETQVTLKLKRDGREYAVPLNRLSDDDQQFVKSWSKEAKDRLDAEAAARKNAERAVEVNRKVAQFGLDSIGRQVGNGECYSLAHDAFVSAGVTKPDRGGRVWGRLIDWEKEKLLPGDILEMESAKFPNLTTGEHHTAIIVEGGRRGNITVCEQNRNGVKKVVKSTMDLRSLISGTIKVYRFE